MNDPLQSRSDLEAFLATLPPVRDGFLRVYRGQSTRYPKLLASGNRGAPSKRELVWGVYSNALAKRMSGTMIATAEDGYASLEDVLYWFQAIKQHYGPGSPFIDVTHSLDVGLWFAMHQGKWMRSAAGIGRGETLGVDLFPVVRRWLGYHASTNSGWLYVLDVRLASAVLSVKHGAFVDLREQAPHVFRTSARIQAQQACLVFADSSTNDGDLSEFLACPPIEIAPSVALNAPWLGKVSAMFPSPDDDPWYAQFLGIPEWWDLDGDESERSFIAPSLNVTLYAPATEYSEKELLQLGERLFAVEPLLLLNEILSHDTIPDALRQTVGILLEAPITLATPPLETGQWHEEALWRGITGMAPVYESETGKSVGKILLDNLFFEFCPLERADWDSYGTNETFRSLRGIWLRHVARDTRGHHLFFWGGRKLRTGLEISESTFWPSCVW